MNLKKLTRYELAQVETILNSPLPGNVQSVCNNDDNQHIICSMVTRTHMIQLDRLFDVSRAIGAYPESNLTVKLCLS